MPENELEFEKKDNVKALFSSFDECLRSGRFTEGLHILDEVMRLDFNYPMLFDNMRAVTFWKNREAKIAAVSGSDRAHLLIGFFDTFQGFCERKGGTAIAAFEPIRVYVFSEIRTELETGYTESGDRTLLHDLGRSLFELGEYAKAADTFEHIWKSERSNSYILALLAESLWRSGDDKRSRLFLREALFYDPAAIPVRSMTMPLFASLMQEARTNGFVEEDDALRWLGVYFEVSPECTVKRALNDEEVLTIRKNCARLESDFKRLEARKEAEPRLLLAYFWLASHLIAARAHAGADEQRIAGELTLLVNKIVLVNEPLCRRFTALVAQ
ncbi:MAG: hypothetical protein HZC28_18910 [Spirochaetes bacterium]|nr:hypothetical protein [Spirochaetota bacterium]